MLHTDIRKFIGTYTDNNGIVYNRVMNVNLDETEVANMSLSDLENMIDLELNGGTLVERLKWFVAFATPVYGAESIDVYASNNLIVIEAHFANSEFKEHIAYED